MNNLVYPSERDLGIAIYPKLEIESLLQSLYLHERHCELSI